MIKWRCPRSYASTAPNAACPRRTWQQRQASTSTTTPAASNGSTDTTTAEATGQKENPFGMAKVREAETYHDATLLHETVYEASQLCTAIRDAVSDAYFRDVRKTKKASDTGLTATQTAESPPMQIKVRELLNCLQAAQTYVLRLLVSTYEPPF